MERYRRRIVGTEVPVPCPRVVRRCPIGRGARVPHRRSARLRSSFRTLKTRTAPRVEPVGPEPVPAVVEVSVSVAVVVVVVVVVAAVAVLVAATVPVSVAVVPAAVASVSAELVPSPGPDPAAEVPAVVEVSVVAIVPAVSHRHHHLRRRPRRRPRRLRRRRLRRTNRKRVIPEVPPVELEAHLLRPPGQKEDRADIVETKHGTSTRSHKLITQSINRANRK